MDPVAGSRPLPQLDSTASSTASVSSAAGTGSAAPLEQKAPVATATAAASAASAAHAAVHSAASSSTSEADLPLLLRDDDCVQINVGDSLFAVSPDARQLATGDRKRTAKTFTISLWEPSTARKIRELATRTGRSSYFASLEFSPDSQLLLYSCVDVAYVWDTCTGHQMTKFEQSSLLMVAWLPAGAGLQNIVVQNFQYPAPTELSLYNVGTGAFRLLDLGQDAGHTTLCLRWSRLAIARKADSDGAKFWSIHEITSNGDLRSLQQYPFTQGEQIVCGPADLVAIGSQIRERCVVWRKDRQLQTFAIKPLAVLGPMEFSSTGRTLICGGDGVNVWDVNTGAQLANLRVCTVANTIAANGRLLASSQFGGPVCVHPNLAFVTSLVQWLRISISIAFLRANRDHPFRTSILALLPMLQQLAIEELDIPTVAEYVQKQQFNVDRFLGGKYARQQLQDRQGPGEAPAACAAAK